MNQEKVYLNEQEKVLVRWWVSKNWGDALNPVLVKNISGQEVVWCDYPKYIKNLDRFFSKWKFIQSHQDMVNPITMSLLSYSDLIRRKGYSYLHKFFNCIPEEDPTIKNVFLVVGSILHQVDRNAIIWGAGFISENSRLREKPKLICAVRGPLTRDIIIRQGLECPEVYGDPALLYPRFYKPSMEKKYKLGVVPHFVDQNSHLLDQFKNKEEVLVIDVTGGINKFVDEICSCEKIASSSLHGIIASDAYGIPSTWISLSDNVIGKGFKFRDYFASVGRNVTHPLTISEKTTLQELFNSFVEYKINIDLDKLLSVCPFKRDSIQPNDKSNKGLVLL